MHLECILSSVLAVAVVAFIALWRDCLRETKILRRESERVPALTVELPRGPGERPACAKCRGSGYVSEGVFCDCGMGKDLARLRRFDERRFGA
jgi:hypothetical protein